MTFCPGGVTFCALFVALYASSSTLYNVGPPRYLSWFISPITVFCGAYNSCQSLGWMNQLITFGCPTLYTISAQSSIAQASGTKHGTLRSHGNKKTRWNNQVNMFKKKHTWHRCYGYEYYLYRIPSGKRWHSYGKSHVLWDNSLLPWPFSKAILTQP